MCDIGTATSVAGCNRVPCDRVPSSRAEPSPLCGGASTRSLASLSPTVSTFSSQRDRRSLPRKPPLPSFARRPRPPPAHSGKSKGNSSHE